MAGSNRSRAERRIERLTPFLGHPEVCGQVYQQVLSTALSMLAFLEVNLPPVLQQVAAMITQMLVQRNPGVRCPIYQMHSMVVAAGHYYRKRKKKDNENIQKKYSLCRIYCLTMVEYFIRKGAVGCDQ